MDILTIHSCLLIREFISVEIVRLQAEDLCHQEQFIDVTLSCGDHNFPAHKLILSVCSPYFRHLFLRNPCKHPIVVLKDVHFKYMKLLLMYMYRGEVSCPQEDLHGLLKTARDDRVLFICLPSWFP